MGVEVVLSQLTRISFMIEKSQLQLFFSKILVMGMIIIDILSNTEVNNAIRGEW